MLWSDVNSFRRTWDPWREFDRMQRAFQNIGPAKAAEFPAVNVWANGDVAIVTAELPGIEPTSVDISVVGKAVTIRGERQPESVKSDETYHRQERWYGKFSRTLELPFTVDSGKVEAKFSRGVLSITLPRSEADKPRKISVVSE